MFEQKKCFDFLNFYSPRRLDNTFTRSQALGELFDLDPRL